MAETLTEDQLLEDAADSLSHLGATLGNTPAGFRAVIIASGGGDVLATIKEMDGSSAHITTLARLFG